MEIIFSHSLCIGSDRSALNGNSEFLCPVCGIDSNLICGVVSVGKTQIKIFTLKVNERKDDDVFNLFPDNPGHLIAVHLDDWRLHLDLAHIFLLKNKIQYAILSHYRLCVNCYLCQEAAFTRIISKAYLSSIRPCLTSESEAQAARYVEIRRFIAKLLD